MRFPAEFIERLRNHIPLSEVVGKRVPVKRHGREFHALCPFHKEKSPSFTVNDEKGFFHCFGCAAHGDAIGFIMDYEKISYPEAVERLAIEAGLAIPAMTQEAQAQEQRRHTLEDAVALAAEWFAAQLATPAAQEARQYLKTRGVSEDTIARFGLGYAPEARDALKSVLMGKNISESMLIEAGLLIRPDTGASYDRFRGRLMFPIRNAQGKAVAFGGRILPSAQAGNAAKYLNSPETPLFKKGEMLFAYDIARKSARDKGNLVVAEGYMDVIALHQAGFTTAVAPLGTAITEAQLKLLWRLVPEPTLCLDGDEAGRRAMVRAMELALPMLKPSFGLKFATLPAGEDPDSMIRASGSKAMLDVLTGAQVMSHALWNQALLNYGAQTAEKKAALEQHLMQTADRIGDAIVKQHMRDYFREQMFALKRARKFGKAVPVASTPNALPQANHAETQLKKLENQLAALVLLYPEMLYQSDIDEQFGHMDFTQPELDKLRSSALQIAGCRASLDSEGLRGGLTESGHGQTVEMLLQFASRNFSKNLSRNNAVAHAAWTQTYENYTMTKLTQEKSEADFAFQQDMSQVNFDRANALQKQLDDLRLRYAVAGYDVAGDEQFS
jgi:DNA primase